MKITPRVKFLNLFRNLFRISPIEKMLAKATKGKTANHILSRLVPNPYQYPLHSYRTVDVNGIKLTVDISDYLGHGLYFGFVGEEWQSNNDLFDLVSKGSNVLDIGSNIGFTLLTMAKLSGNGMVIGFEPDQLNYSRCLQNIKQNSFQNAKVLNYGLGSQEMELSMEVRVEFNRGGNRIAPHGEGHKIKVKRLDDIFPTLEIGKIDLIKIDVEGYELNVLEGGVQLLSSHPVLFIELNDNNLRDQSKSAKELIAFLFRSGYSSIIRADNKIEVNLNTDFSDCHYDIIAR